MRLISHNSAQRAAQILKILFKFTSCVGQAACPASTTCIRQQQEAMGRTRNYQEFRAKTAL